MAFGVFSCTTVLLRTFLGGTTTRPFPFMSLPGVRNAAVRSRQIRVNGAKWKTDDAAERVGVGIASYDPPLFCSVPNDV
jgi:hypothetical protein